MSSDLLVGHTQPYFEDVAVGDALTPREHGPLTIMDTVRWAGIQENVARLHYDREYAREHSGQRSFIASGHYRQALLGRMVTDWIGPRGRLRALSMRNLYPTVEGDLMRFNVRIVDKSSAPADPWIALELEGTNQEGRPIMAGRCTVTLPTRGDGVEETCAR